MGMDYTHLTGKHIRRWVALDAHLAPSPHPKTTVDGSFLWQPHPSAPPHTLSTDSVLVLEVGPPPSPPIIHAAEQQHPPEPAPAPAQPCSHVAQPEPLVPGVPLFGSSRADQAKSCAHCSTLSSSQWRPGWDVSVSVPSYSADSEHPTTRLPCNLCQGCGLHCIVHAHSRTDLSHKVVSKIDGAQPAFSHQS